MTTKLKSWKEFIYSIVSHFSGFIGFLTWNNIMQLFRTIILLLVQYIKKQFPDRTLDY